MSGWIATIGVPKGHRVRFLYTGDVRTVECECGWKLTYAGDNRQYALIAHARHAHDADLLARFRADSESIGARDAFAELVEYAGDQRFDDAPHPAEDEP